LSQYISVLFIYSSAHHWEQVLIGFRWILVICAVGSSCGCCTRRARSPFCAKKCARASVPLAALSGALGDPTVRKSTLGDIVPMKQWIYQQLKVNTQSWCSNKNVNWVPYIVVAKAGANNCPLVEKMAKLVILQQWGIVNIAENILGSHAHLFTNVDVINPDIPTTNAKSGRVSVEHYRLHAINRQALVSP
jgi:hypothetical protein